MNGHQFYRLNNDLETPKISTFSEMHDWHWSVRMYEIKGSQFCPVKSLTQYLSRLNPDIAELFQRPVETANPPGKNWYSGVMGHNSILKMMSDISVDTKLSTVYTNICLKATITDLLEKQGFNTFSILHLQSKGKHSSQTPEELRQNSMNMHYTFYKSAYGQASQI